jgi:predicted nucleic acid-binding Zn ribbon protein
MRDPEKDFGKTVEVVRRRQRKFKPTQDAAALVARVMNKRSIAGRHAASELTQLWQAAIGAVNGRQTQVVAVRRGVLEVIVANSSVHQQLIFQKKQILKKLNNTDRATPIKDIRYRVGQIH